MLSSVSQSTAGHLENPLTLLMVVNVCDVVGCCSSRGLAFVLAW